MKLDSEYSGQILKHASAKRAIVGSDPKEYRRVSLIKVKVDFIPGMLEDILVGDDNDIADSYSYISCSFDQRTGSYELSINDIPLTCVINRIDRKNKNDLEGELHITFETGDIEKAGAIGLFLKDKENPTKLILKSV